MNNFTHNLVQRGAGNAPIERSGKHGNGETIPKEWHPGDPDNPKVSGIEIG